VVSGYPLIFKITTTSTNHTTYCIIDDYIAELESNSHCNFGVIEPKTQQLYLTNFVVGAY